MSDIDLTAKPGSALDTITQIRKERDELRAREAELVEALTELRRIIRQHTNRSISECKALDMADTALANLNKPASGE